MSKILVINPGSTSTKVGVYEKNDFIFEKTLRHDPEELAVFKSVIDQYEYRKEKIVGALEENDIKVESLVGIACRGGIGKATIGGTYIVTDDIIEDYKNSPYQHPANLAAIIGKEIADGLGDDVKAYFVDSAMSDESSEIAAFSGHKEIKRPLRGHFLNQKAIARKCAQEIGVKYNEANLIVAHLGGGISIAAHVNGKVLDITDGIDEGPFTPERTGILPVRKVIDLCYSGKYTHQEMKAFVQGEGGIKSYLGTTDAREAEEMMVQGSKEAEMVLKAMAYQISKDIGALATTVNGKVDAIALTGGIAYSENITDWIKERVGFISPVKVYPGEMELEALALGVLRVLGGEELPVNFN